MPPDFDAHRVRAELRLESEAMVGETIELARIDSGSADPEGVDRVAALVCASLAGLGFEIESAPLEGRGALTRATLPLGAGPKLSIVGHCDTVWPAGAVAENPPRREGDWLRGPGVGDMKGCLVMAVHAVAAALRAGVEGIGAIEVLLVPDEELGSTGSRSWIEGRVRGAGACLGLEAGWPGGGVVVARGAVGAVQVAARGVAAHSAGHEGEGVSAVAGLAPLVAELEALADPASGLLVSVGTFHGGVARQVVPDRALVDVDLRAPDADRAAALLSAVQIAVQARDRPPLHVELTGGFTRPPFPESASEPLWRLARARAEELGMPLVAQAARGGSDASFAAALGVPTLDGLGPICHDSCAREERIEIASMADRAALMCCLILDLDSGWRSPGP